MLEKHHDLIESFNKADLAEKFNIFKDVIQNNDEALVKYLWDFCTSAEDKINLFTHHTTNEQNTSEESISEESISEESIREESISEKTAIFYDICCRGDAELANHIYSHFEKNEIMNDTNFKGTLYNYFPDLFNKLAYLGHQQMAEFIWGITPNNIKDKVLSYIPDGEGADKRSNQFLYEAIQQGHINFARYLWNNIIPQDYHEFVLNAIDTFQNDDDLSICYALTQIGKYDTKGSLFLLEIGFDIIKKDILNTPHHEWHSYNLDFVSSFWNRLSDNEKNIFLMERSLFNDCTTYKNLMFFWNMASTDQQQLIIDNIDLYESQEGITARLQFLETVLSTRETGKLLTANDCKILHHLCQHGQYSSIDYILSNFPDNITINNAWKNKLAPVHQVWVDLYNTHQPNFKNDISGLIHKFKSYNLEPEAADEILTNNRKTIIKLFQKHSNNGNKVYKELKKILKNYKPGLTVNDFENQNSIFVNLPDEIKENIGEYLNFSHIELTQPNRSKKRKISEVESPEETSHVKRLKLNNNNKSSSKDM